MNSGCLLTLASQPVGQLLLQKADWLLSALQRTVENICAAGGGSESAQAHPAPEVTSPGEDLARAVSRPEDKEGPGVWKHVSDWLGSVGVALNPEALVNVSKEGKKAIKELKSRGLKKMNETSKQPSFQQSFVTRVLFWPVMSTWQYLNSISEPYVASETETMERPQGEDERQTRISATYGASEVYESKSYKSSPKDKLAEDEFLQAEVTISTQRGSEDIVSVPEDGVCAPAASNPAPESANPAPEAANPAPEAANPAPEAANPAPEAANPAPEAANPAPEAANPAPEAANPAPEAANPAPEAANPAPEAANPAPEAANPAPEAANPAPEAANPAPEAANPARKRPTLPGSGQPCPGSGQPCPGSGQPCPGSGPHSPAFSRRRKYSTQNQASEQIHGALCV
ncbi:mucin-7-like [Bacillus rossius redtenbacheri]|uniref:mucin-7-like n=1 Tax=Bacillus rossius redtenbacheri TaxID=93214 RepID=UPI002FDC8E61